MGFSLLRSSKMEDPEIKLSIELDGVGKDEVIVLRGERDRAASIFISGKLRVITNILIEVKHLNIKLLGKSRLNVPLRNMQLQKDFETPFIRSESYFFQHIWNKTLTPCSTKALGPPTSDEFTNEIKQKSRGCFKSILSVMKGYEGKIDQMEAKLEPGEHVFYFTAILPGDLPESIHNHPNVFVAYQLSATIQQLRGLPDLKIEKQLMIIRTVSIDMLDFQNSEHAQAKLKHIFVVNAELPWKIAAIGSTVDVCCLIRSKNVDFKITETIIELFEYGLYQMGKIMVSKRRKISGVIISDPSFTSKNITLDTKERIEWYRRFNFRIPDSLGQLTQDCYVLKKIKVSHLLEIGVTVSMPHGKFYRLDLQLPIYLYISTFIPLKIKERNYFKEPTIHYCPPPIEGGEPLECNCTILEGFTSQENHTNIPNQDILMKDLFPSSYENHVNDAKIEMLNHTKIRDRSLAMDKSIVKCNATNSAQYENLYEIRYPPPCYEKSTDGLNDISDRTILERSIDLVDMGEVYYDKFQNERILSSFMNMY
ncbi:hypothetical protein MOSE0_J05600 [Monosporozyma servazzii]